MCVGVNACPIYAVNMRQVNLKFLLSGSIFAEKLSRVYSLRLDYFYFTEVVLYVHDKPDYKGGNT